MMTTIHSHLDWRFVCVCNFSRIGPFKLSYYKESSKATAGLRQKDEGALPSKSVGGFKIELSLLDARSVELSWLVI